MGKWACGRAEVVQGLRQVAGCVNGCGARNVQSMESGFSVLSRAGVARALGAVAEDARVPAAGGIRSLVLGAGSRTRSFAECYCSHRAHATRRDRRDGYPPHLILHLSRNRLTAVTANISGPLWAIKPGSEIHSSAW